MNTMHAPHLNIVPDNYHKTPSTDELACRLEIKNLSLHIKDKKIFGNITLPVYSNHINALIGPSGCGKSSILNCITRLTDFHPQHAILGEILLDKQNILSQQTDLIALRRKIGMIFQKPMPFPLSIRQNFEIPLKEHGIKQKSAIDDIIENSLQRVGLWKEVRDRLHHNAQLLSGGQQQRLCIARALSLNPEILLLDEPCSALDPIATQTIESLLQELKNNYTILIVTHNLAQAKRLADYTGFMWYAEDYGRLVEHNRSDVIFNSASNPLTKAYVQGITE
ncbi:MAG: phosphate ABC transporter ATP-binding protein [Gammaproteobacteria bacterium]|nr:phosphate ABC transporter ATP-binding protein [Gammaproteobacteria bacterium]